MLGQMECWVCNRLCHEPYEYGLLMVEGFQSVVGVEVEWSYGLWPVEDLI
jgi:hypothetical protein